MKMDNFKEKSENLALKYHLVHTDRHIHAGLLDPKKMGPRKDIFMNLNQVYSKE
jgi:hypothetical protein